YRSRYARALHSFPTRRSSDLSEAGFVIQQPIAVLTKNRVDLGLDPGHRHLQGVDLVVIHLQRSLTGRIQLDRVFIRETVVDAERDRKSTRLNSSHGKTSYAVF